MTKIASVRSTAVRVPFAEARGGSGATALEVLHVEIADTDGASGTGFTYTLGGGVEALHALMNSMVDRIAGTDPLDWERTSATLLAGLQRLGRGVVLGVISALDIAMWDLRAASRGLPLHRLLGSHRDAVPIYGSGRSTNSMTVDQLVAGAISYVEEGYRSIKLRAGTRPIAEDASRIGSVRAALGAGIGIMVDCNERLSLPDAITLASRIEPYLIDWLEEPLPAGQIAAHRTLATQITIPLAVGEHLQGRHECVEYLQSGVISVIQPDAPLVGGVSEWMRIATVADALGVSVSPHFLPELHVQLAAAAPSCSSIEHFPLIDDLLEETLEIRDGVALAPNRPGHGIAWSSDALRHFQVAA